MIFIRAGNPPTGNGVLAQTDGRENKHPGRLPKGIRIFFAKGEGERWADAFQVICLLDRQGAFYLLVQHAVKPVA
ncbi:hypothetical protein UN63_02605 [Oceanisphaera arctica]|uniref:Uncharacterized protein n=1 Tax=Oceanisphaera arctica TaxID=641510 RepID=A0A2P5TQL2_9GAMM|nr:hypothetical protein UN63_02605 [Oceanisphaera arctica]GHA09608.1 hypothetical protein GCM10007082_08190 [Oceanisphaera arctica]